jgi:hypothetical protein
MFPNGLGRNFSDVHTAKKSITGVLIPAHNVELVERTSLDEPLIRVIALDASPHSRYYYYYYYYH